jgi:hypothetical protein
MGATRQDVIDTLNEVRTDVERLVETTPESAWSKGVYENGWNAKQVLGHLAAMSGVANFVMMMANAPGGGMGSGGAFDIDQFNAQQTAMREGKTPSELLDEVRSNFTRDIGGVEKASDDLLFKHYRAPWEVEGNAVEGTVADVIVGSLKSHYRGHLAELAAALARS